MCSFWPHFGLYRIRQSWIRIPILAFREGWALSTHFLQRCPSGLLSGPVILNFEIFWSDRSICLEISNSQSVHLSKSHLFVHITRTQPTNCNFCATRLQRIGHIWQNGNVCSPSSTHKNMQINMKGPDAPFALLAGANAGACSMLSAIKLFGWWWTPLGTATIQSIASLTRWTSICVRLPIHL